MITFLLHVAQIGVFVFSFRFFLRNLDESLVKRRIKPELMTKIVTAFVSLSIFGAVFADYFVLFVLFLLILGQLTIHFVQVFRNWRLENAVLMLVQHIILNISAGKSFKEAYFLSIQSQKTALQLPFKTIWDIQKLSEQDFPGNRTYKLSIIVRQCRANSSSCLDLLKELRRNMQLEDNFLLKVRTGLSQIRSQLLFICLFYVAMLGILLKMQLHSQYLSWIFLSFALFVTGSLLVWYLPRRFKWSN